MKSLFAFVLMLGFTGSALAQDFEPVKSIRARDYTCIEIQSLVKAEGILHIQTGWSSNIYHAKGTRCGPRHVPVAGWLYDSERSACFAGYICKRSSNNDD